MITYLLSRLWKIDGTNRTERRFRYYEDDDWLSDEILAKMKPEMDVWDWDSAKCTKLGDTEEYKNALKQYESETTDEPPTEEEENALIKWLRGEDFPRK